jgi:hypothetical protein
MALAILGVGLVLASLPAWRMQHVALSAAMKEY